MKTRLDKVLGFEGTPAPKTKAESTVIEGDDVPSFSNSEDDEDLDYFKSLAEQN